MATNRLSAEQKQAADTILGRLDKCAADIQENHKKWGLSLEDARPLVNYLDRIADDFEKRVYGDTSLRNRQIEVLKQAKVIQRDKDEPYMDSFVVDQGVVQQDGDEPYMAAYSDDQSSAVQTGKSTTGKPLAPGA